MNHTNSYAELMALAENTTSRKEARHIINESTKIMNQETTQADKVSYYTNRQLQAFIKEQQANIIKHESAIRTANLMIDMLDDVLKKQSEAVWHAKAITASGWCYERHHLLKDNRWGKGNALSTGIG